MIYLGLFFLTPLVSLVITSLKTASFTGEIGMYDYAFQVSNYAYALEQYLPQITRSFLYALVATFMALLISYPIAYFIGVKARNKPVLQAFLLTLVIAPFFISFLLRTFAWKQIFSNESPATQFLQSIGVLAPDQYVIGSSFAVIAGLTYNFIPFMTGALGHSSGGGGLGPVCHPCADFLEGNIPAIAAGCNLRHFADLHPDFW
jgi:spermidine/putrescine transport system permease protein